MSTDLLYYIMDYSENYYRVNNEEQLVVAVGKEEATVFTFSQANSKISVGKKSSFYRMIPVEGENESLDYQKTEVQYSGNEETYDLVQEDISLAKKLTRDEVHCSITKNPSSYDLSEMDWEEYLTHFAYVASNLTDYKDELTKKQSEVDQKICDVLHYIELCETDDNEATDLVELLRVCGENRREIKDELSCIDSFQKNFGTSANVAKAKQNLKTIKDLGKRKYKPRKYDELFENSNMHKAKANMNTTNEVNENRRNYELMQVIKDEGYKIFKKLKELRINRREKQQELNCMYALTDYIDYEALADTCEENLAEVEDIMNVKENDDGLVVAENQAVQKSVEKKYLLTKIKRQGIVKMWKFLIAKTSRIWKIISPKDIYLIVYRWY